MAVDLKRIQKVISEKDKKKFNLKQKQVTPQTEREEMAEDSDGKDETQSYKLAGALAGLTGQYDKEEKMKYLAEKQKYKGKPGYDKNGNPLKTKFFRQGEEMANTGYKSK